MDGVTHDQYTNDINMESNNADTNTENQNSSAPNEVTEEPHTALSGDTKVEYNDEDKIAVKSIDSNEQQNKTTSKQNDVQLSYLKQSCEKNENPIKVQTNRGIEEATSRSDNEQKTSLFKKINGDQRHYRSREEEESGNSESSPTKNQRKRKWRDGNRKEESTPARSSASLKDGNDDSTRLSRPEQRERNRSGERHKNHRDSDRNHKFYTSSSDRRSHSKDKKSSYSHKSSEYDKNEVKTCSKPASKRDSDENNSSSKKSAKTYETSRSQFHGSKSNDRCEASSAESKSPVKDKYMSEKRRYNEDISSSGSSSPIKSKTSTIRERHDSKKRKYDKESSKSPRPKSEKRGKFEESNSDKMKTDSDRGKSTKNDRSVGKSNVKNFPIFNPQQRSNRSESGKEIDLKKRSIIDGYLRKNPLANTALSIVSDQINIYDTTRDNFEFFFGKESPFSQFHQIHFVVDNERYSCAEQFMMHQKAVTFNDWYNAEKIMAETKPLLMKRLGRKVQGFNPNVWDKKSIEVVERGNIEKFKQNAHIEKRLIETYPKILAEASPRDLLWGIGRGAASPEALSIATWRGKNLLGFTLMGVRRTLMIRKGLLKK